MQLNFSTTVELERVHFALGLLGNIGSCVFFLSSLPAVVAIFKKKSSECVPSNFYVFTLFNCMLWIFYGLPIVHPHNFWILITNGLGSAFALCYITAYLIFASKKQRIAILWKLAFIVMDFTALVLVIIFFVHPRHTRMMIVGSVCAIISSCMHMTLLSQLRAFLDTKEARYLHPVTSIAAFWKGTIWTGYGVVNFDWFIVIPNAVGVAVGMGALVLFLVMRPKTFPIKDADQNAEMTSVSIFVHDDDDENHEKKRESQPIGHLSVLKQDIFPTYAETASR